MKWYEKRFKEQYPNSKIGNVESMDGFKESAFGSFKKNVNGYIMISTFQFIRRKEEKDD